ncbi:hypothetical protein Acr_04g0002410 [Actinidia rufa]|uniref:Uncharacterized protein n=1 Tax=Actinidia rufa TaxID=165716 RepID=A0A7J0EGA6_9ERIC|nr:hypothetical protein Acr_04g0002410 [Actinidia rufa]
MAETVGGDRRVIGRDYGRMELARGRVYLDPEDLVTWKEIVIGKIIGGSSRLTLVGASRTTSARGYPDSRETPYTLCVKPLTSSAKVHAEISSARWSPSSACGVTVTSSACPSIHLEVTPLNLPPSPRMTRLLHHFPVVGHQDLLNFLHFGFHAPYGHVPAVLSPPGRD